MLFRSTMTTTNTTITTTATTTTTIITITTITTSTATTTMTMVMTTTINTTTTTTTMTVTMTMTTVKGDLGEFAIILKAPFMPINDKRVKRKMDNDKDWYIDKMLSTVIQMCGRTIRSKNDESTTYILDATLTRVLVENINKLPKYFAARLGA